MQYLYIDADGQHIATHLIYSNTLYIATHLIYSNTSYIYILYMHARKRTFLLRVFYFSPARIHAKVYYNVALPQSDNQNRLKSKEKSDIICFI